MGIGSCSNRRAGPRNLVPASVMYAKTFFDLQLQFADRVTLLSGLPLAHALFEYTNLYIRFGLGRDFDPAHPIWQEYLAGVQDTNDRREWTYRFYFATPGGHGCAGDRGDLRLFFVRAGEW